MKMERVQFDYRKLRGRIIEKCGNQKDFAKAIGTSPTAISLKLCNKGYFNQLEIERAVSVLDIEPGSVTSYFFTQQL